MVLDFEAAGDFLDHGGEHVFGDVDEVVVVGVGHVELAGGVLGVVGLVDRLVSEVFADLEHPLQTAHHALLEEQLGRDSHVEFHIEVVVVGGEGLGGGSSGDHVHHGCFHFHEVEVGEVPPHEAEHLRPDDEGLAGAVVHYQVEVSLSVAGLSVLEAGVRVGEHVQAG